jgi:dTDP-4-amino-4,6-dideoxy-D-glucose acyltransferase
MASSFYSEEELRELGFKSFGHDVKISRKSSFYHTERIEIGSHVRIDDFCVLSACSTGSLKIGSFVHIAAQCLIEAPAGVELHDFSGLAGRCTLYGGTDDYSGAHLTNPCVPWEYRSCVWKPIILEKHALAGAGAVILPGVTMGECSVAGAMSLVTRSIPSGQIHAGIPARFIKERKLTMLDLERDFRLKLAEGAFGCPVCSGKES